MRARTSLAPLPQVALSVLLCLAASDGSRAENASTESLTLEAAFARALEHNPRIAAARQRRAIDLAGVEIARERPNPEAHIEFEREAPKEGYGVAVPLETAGESGR